MCVVIRLFLLSPIYAMILSLCSSKLETRKVLDGSNSVKS